MEWNLFLLAIRSKKLVEHKWVETLQKSVDTNSHPQPYY